MYFGGINGFNVYDPSRVANDPFVPPVVLTDFRLFGKPAPVGGDSMLQKTINEVNALTLPYNQNDISFEFAALSYVAPAKNQYRYKLEGFDADWHEVNSKERLAVYTNLDAGNYVFRVQGTNEDGVWNKEGKALKITIIPPWWETWWFMILAGVFIVALGIAGYSYRVRNLHQRTVQLKREVALCTRELTESNQQLQDTQHTAEAANKAKSVFLANMSHELRTPLNAILSFSGILRKDPQIPDGQLKNLQIITRSGEYLLNLINDILDKAKIEARRIQLENTAFDLGAMVRDVADMMRIRTEEKDLQLMVDQTSDFPRYIVGDEAVTRKPVRRNGRR